MDKIELINDNEVFEGIVGGFAWVISMSFLKFYLDSGRSIYALASAIAWPIMWYIRKVNQNLYRQYKKQYQKEEKQFIYLPLDKKYIFLYYYAVYLSLILFVVTITLVHMNKTRLLPSDIFVYGLSLSVIIPFFTYVF